MKITRQAENYRGSHRVTANTRPLTASEIEALAEIDGLDIVSYEDHPRKHALTDSQQIRLQDAEQDLKDAQENLVNVQSTPHEQRDIDKANNWVASAQKRLDRMKMEFSASRKTAVDYTDDGVAVQVGSRVQTDSGFGYITDMSNGDGKVLVRTDHGDVLVPVSELRRASSRKKAFDYDEEVEQDWDGGNFAVGDSFRLNGDTWTFDGLDWTSNDGRTLENWYVTDMQQKGQINITIGDNLFLTSRRKRASASWSADGMNGWTTDMSGFAETYASIELMNDGVYYWFVNTNGSNGIMDETEIASGSASSLEEAKSAAESAMSSKTARRKKADDSDPNAPKFCPKDGTQKTPEGDCPTCDAAKAQKEQEKATTARRKRASDEDPEDRVSSDGTKKVHVEKWTDGWHYEFAVLDDEDYASQWKIMDEQGPFSSKDEALNAGLPKISRRKRAGVNWQADDISGYVVNVGGAVSVIVDQDDESGSWFWREYNGSQQGPAGYGFSSADEAKSDAESNSIIKDTPAITASRGGKRHPFDRKADAVEEVSDFPWWGQVESIINLLENYVVIGGSGTDALLARLDGPTLSDPNRTASVIEQWLTENSLDDETRSLIGPQLDRLRTTTASRRHAYSEGDSVDTIYDNTYTRDEYGTWWSDSASASLSDQDVTEMMSNGTAFSKEGSVQVFANDEAQTVMIDFNEAYGSYRWAVQGGQWSQSVNWFGERGDEIFKTVMDQTYGPSMTGWDPALIDSRDTDDGYIETWQAV